MASQILPEKWDATERIPPWINLPECEGVDDQSFLLGRLHEFDSSSIGVANIDHTFPGVRTRAESLRFAGGAPAGGGDRLQHRVKIIHGKRDMRGSNIARPDIDSFSVFGRPVFEQFDFVSGSFENGERNLRAGHTSDFLGELTGLMRAMRKLEAEHIAPESK